MKKEILNLVESNEGEFVLNNNRRVTDLRVG